MLEPTKRRKIALVDARNVDMFGSPPLSRPGHSAPEGATHSADPPVPSVARGTTAVRAVQGIALLTVIVFGMLRHQGEFLCDYDARFWYVGGTCWWNGASPYSLDAFLAAWSQAFGSPPAFRAAFVYPGSVLPVALGLGALSWDAARWVMRVVNLITLLASLGILRGIARDEHGRVTPARDVWLGVAAIAPGVALTMFQGQLSLLAMLGVCVTWRGFLRASFPWLATGFVLASIKPQLTVVPMLFLLLRHATPRAWGGVAVALAVNCLVFAWSDPMRLLADLRSSLAEHAAQEFNRPDNYDSLVAHLPVVAAGTVTEVIGALLGCAFAVLLGRRARTAAGALPYGDIRLLQVALVVTGAVMPVHRYDLVIHVPLVATAWALGSPWRGAAVFACVMVHAGASSICWHFGTMVGVDLDYHAFAATVAALELALVILFWHLDTTQGPVAAAPAGAPR